MKRLSGIIAMVFVMLMVFCTVMASGCSILDKINNQWAFDRAEVAEPIANKDAGDLLRFMSPYMMAETGLTEDDLQEFLDRCDIENNSSADMDRYTAFEFLGDPHDPEGNHYRPDG